MVMVNTVYEGTASLGNSEILRALLKRRTSKAALRAEPLRIAMLC